MVHSRDLIGNCIGFMSFWNWAVKAKSGIGVFLPLDLNLELGPSVFTLGGCAFCTLGGGTGTLGGIMLGPERDM